MNSITLALESANTIKEIAGLNTISPIFDKCIDITYAFTSNAYKFYNDTNFNTFEKCLDSSELENLSSDFICKTEAILNSNYNISEKLSKSDRYNLTIQIIMLIFSVLTFIHTLSSEQSVSDTKNNTTVTYNVNYQDNKTINNYTTNNYYVNKDALDEYLNTRIKEIIAEQMTE